MKEKQILEMIEIIENTNKRKDLNEIFNKKNKLRNTYLKNIKFIKIFFYSLYTFSLIYFTIINSIYFFNNDYTFSLNDMVDFVFCAFSLIIIFIFLDFISLIYRKFFNLRFKYLLEEKKEDSLFNIINNYNFQTSLSFIDIIHNEIQKVNNEDDQIIEKIIKKNNIKIKSKFLIELIENNKFLE